MKKNINFISYIKVIIIMMDNSIKHFIVNVWAKIFTYAAVSFSTTQTLKFQLYRTKATRFCHQNLQSMHIYFRLLLENQNINDN